MLSSSSYRRITQVVYAASATAATLFLSACAAPAPTGDAAQADLLANVDVDKMLVVDCLLPGQIRKLGTSVTYLTTRRPIKTTAGDCEIRGGEYVAYDRANYATALRIWLPQAEEGDASAQTYVGEIYERGLGTAPDYSRAAQWYQKASDQGNSRAQINLGQLYEQGRGVPKNTVTAINLYRRASGLSDDELAFTSSIRELETQIQTSNQTAAQSRREVGRLHEQLERTQQQLEATRNSLNASQRELEENRRQLQQRRSTPGASAPTPPDNEALRSLERRVAEKEKLIQEQSEQIGYLEQEAQFQLDQLNTTRQEKQSLQQQVKGLQDELNASKAQLQASRQELAQRKLTLQQTEQALERERKATAVGDSAEAQRLEQELGALNASLDQTQRRVQVLETEVKEREANINRLQRQSSRDQQEKQSLQRQVEELQQELGSSQNQLQVRKQELKRQQLALQQAQQTLEQEHKALVAQDSFEIQRLEKLLNDHTIALAKTQGQVNALEEEVQVREANVKELTRGGDSVGSGSTEPSPLPSPARLDFGRYHALIIGNNSYADLPNLETAVNDAQAVGRLLRSRYGFQTKVLTNANRDVILRELNAFRKKLTEQDNFLLYYAGHGELDRTNNRGYWLPVNAEYDSTTNWILNQQITDILNLMNAKHIMVIADSCYSGSLLTRAVTTSIEGGRSEDKRAKWLQHMIATRSRTVLTSGDLAPVLDSGGGGHSVFANSLLEVLGTNNDVLEGPLLYRAVLRQVKAAAKRLKVDQNPQYAPIRFAGDEGAPFLFRPIDA